MLSPALDTDRRIESLMSPQTPVTFLTSLKGNPYVLFLTPTSRHSSHIAVGLLPYDQSSNSVWNVGSVPKNKTMLAAGKRGRSSNKNNWRHLGHDHIILLSRLFLAISRMLILRTITLLTLYIDSEHGQSSNCRPHVKPFHSLCILNYCSQHKHSEWGGEKKQPTNKYFLINLKYLSPNMHWIRSPSLKVSIMFNIITYWIVLYFPHSVAPMHHHEKQLINMHPTFCLWPPTECRKEESGERYAEVLRAACKYACIHRHTNVAHLSVRQGLIT